MSYHILHQFDEQWFGDSGQEKSSETDNFFRASGDQSRKGQNPRSRSRQHSWLIIGASLIIAACALFFAMDARRQALELQQRLTDVESRLKK